LKAKFERLRVNGKGPFVHIPLQLYVKNAGTIPAYILMDNYKVKGRQAKPFDGSDADMMEGWREDVDKMDEEDAQLHVRKFEYTEIGVGQFQGPGSWLAPGEEYYQQKLIHVPRRAEYDTVEVELKLWYMRKDRSRLDSEFGVRKYSWSRAAGRHYCPKCGEYLVYQGRVQHNNNLVNVTRKPRYVTAFWSPMHYDFFISSFRSDAALGVVERNELVEESKREQGRYGITSVDANAVISVAEVLGVSAG
jgi:hypothetical protein